eukprot:CAMPEP_0113627582 /NCGR_PEP_ID=MMETSP0017_2-20120614/14288_1 /TAXON_ID=2856 /ORGANISM="Cylindrotheca closterium" /LENGTH=569 /DNA_ID=CAMNT_0000537849 /DNA_START=5 /DNA_END=1714 /DNA_ORIENTATION=- /assembly_acc=CAM_ASM_000147
MVLSKKKAILLPLALFGALAHAVTPEDEESNAKLVRKRTSNENPKAARTTGDIWDEVAAKAELEKEADEMYRDLQRMSMSPARSPTMPPVFQPTLSPVSCGGQSREQYLMAILSQLVDVNVLENRLTPQGKAFEYMALFDEYLADPCGKNIPQRFSLLTLYYSTKGENWTNNARWLTGQQECNWDGIDCVNNLVTNINLEINNLDGTIPEELEVLTQLTELNFFANSLIGSIPDSIQALTNLESLDLQENELSGEAFPPQMWFLTNLKSYKVTGNSLSDPIPTQIGLLRGLEELWISDNGIDGSIPTEIGNLRSLTTLALHENEIKGTIPTELALIPFKELFLHSNFLSNELPESLFNVASLTEFRLDGNFFTGDLPTNVGILTNLIDFRVDNNNLDGTIPPQLRELTNLQYLKLGDNFWTGRVPNIFGDYEALEYFDLSGNEALSGDIPASVFSVPTIRFVYMHECPGLGGTIPSSFQNAGELRDLYLYSTDVGGTIPTISSNKLLELNEFLIQDTRITGSMPESVCALRTDGVLDDLWSDCGGSSPEIQCDFPDCCNRCFEGTVATS